MWTVFIDWRWCHWWIAATIMDLSMLTAYLVDVLGQIDLMHIWLLLSTTFPLLFHSFILSFLTCTTPLWVCSTKCRYQSPEWVILSQVDCFVQAKIKWFHVLLDSLHPRGARASWWSPPVLHIPRGKLLRSSLHCFIWQVRSVAELGETPCLDNGR